MRIYHLIIGLGLGLACLFLVEHRLTRNAGAKVSSQKPVPQSPAPARVQFRNPVLQLPTMLLSEIPSMGNLLEAPYELQNRSNESVTLVYQGTSCGCTGVRIDGKEAKPGDMFSLAPSGQADVRLMIRLASGSGEKTYSAAFNTRSVSNGPTQLIAQAHVRVLNDIEFSPQALVHEFKNLNSEKVEKILTIKRYYRSPCPLSGTLGLAGIPSTVELISVQETSPSRKVTEEIWSRGWRIRLAIQPAPELQEVNQSYPLAFTFNGMKDQSLPVTSIPLILRRTFGVQAPKFIQFGSIPKENGRTRRILVRSMDGKNFAVTKIGINSSWISVSPPSAQPRSTHWFDITYRTNEVGTHQAQIMIETDHPDCPRLVIDVTGTTVES